MYMYYYLGTKMLDHTIFSVADMYFNYFYILLQSLFLQNVAEYKISVHSLFLM